MCANALKFHGQQLQVGIDVFGYITKFFKAFSVTKRGYAEVFSRAKPHMNIGTIGSFTGLYQERLDLESIRPC